MLQVGQTLKGVKCHYQLIEPLKKEAHQSTVFKAAILPSRETPAPAPWSAY